MAWLSVVVLPLSFRGRPLAPLDSPGTVLSILRVALSPFLCLGTREASAPFQSGSRNYHGLGGQGHHGGMRVLRLGGVLRRSLPTSPPADTARPTLLMVTCLRENLAATVVLPVSDISAALVCFRTLSCNLAQPTPTSTATATSTGSCISEKRQTTSSTNHRAFAASVRQHPARQ